MKNLVLAFSLLFSSTACFADEARGRGKPEIQHKEREHHRPEMRRGHQYHGQHHGGHQHWRAPQHRPPVGFRPTIGWLPQGFHLGVGPISVGPDRRHVRFGISAGFYGAPRVHTFNYYGRHR